MKTILVATTNPGKAREIRHVIDGMAGRILTLTDLPPTPEPEETGATFADNAVLKARAYAEAFRLPTVAEDSGLVIDALGGRPGVLSARYPGRTYAEKFANLHRELAPHPRPWTARFVCSLAFVMAPEGTSTGSVSPVTFADEATVEGEIAPEPRGAHGFGYDPIFYYAPYGCTLGEATDAQKLAISHRGGAFRQFRAWYETRSARSPSKG